MRKCIINTTSIPTRTKTQSNKQTTIDNKTNDRKGWPPDFKAHAKRFVITVVSVLEYRDNNHRLTASVIATVSIHYAIWSSLVDILFRDLLLLTFEDLFFVLLILILILIFVTLKETKRFLENSLLTITNTGLGRNSTGAYLYTTYNTYHCTITLKCPFLQDSISIQKVLCTEISYSRRTDNFVRRSAELVSVS